MMTALSSNRMTFEGQNSPTRGILDFISIYRKLVAKGSCIDGVKAQPHAEIADPGLGLDVFSSCIVPR
jgi:hypothetical protein